MSDAVLIFTFSPIQQFIAAARRTSDLYVGSKMLAQLSQAAARAIEQHGTLIYPAELSLDVPNKIVARIPEARAGVIVQGAQQALIDEWQRIAKTASRALRRLDPTPDGVWQAIWERQTARHWETYWVVASTADRSYRVAYEEATRALDAAKRTRLFEASEEPGLKDSLSGQREALHTAGQDARAYWAAVSQQVIPAKLRPDGRERLDAIGVVKRFSELADQTRFPSTSTVASADFLARASEHLAGYRHALRELLGDRLYRVRDDGDWPYDGDLLFTETLTPERLSASYGLTNPDPLKLQTAQRALTEVYKLVGDRPSPYFAVLVLDGDSIGERVGECLTAPDPETAHRELSQRLTTFARQVNPIAKQYQGSLVYNGGDDVLALAPLSSAMSLARALAREFEAVTGGTASAGVALVHHLYPLGAALRAARQAEASAKQFENRRTNRRKDAVSVCALKRGGETLEARSSWDLVEEVLPEVVKWFGEEALSSRFAYDVAQTAHNLPEANEAFKAEMKRLIKRHRDPRASGGPEPELWAERLTEWAASLPEQSEGLGRWLIVARFLAQRGKA